MRRSSSSFWLLLMLPPLFFLLNVVVFSVYFGVSGEYAAEQISSEVNRNVPFLLLISQLEMLGLLLYYARRGEVNLVESTFASGRFKGDVLRGVLLGLFLAAFYKFVIADVLIYLQGRVGDYVPEDSLNDLKSNLFVFGVANVVLAPFVEENIYRNLALVSLQSRYGDFRAIVISSIFFGLLHWLGGVWYMLATTLFVGFPFAVIALKRRSLLLVFVAHLTLNFVEFVM